jgi:hypothetical protein
MWSRQPYPEDTVGVFDLRPFYTALLDGQLLAKSKVFQDQVLPALEQGSK